jgi:hypothetical protein
MVVKEDPALSRVLGRAVLDDSVKTRVESAPGFRD